MSRADPLLRDYSGRQAGQYLQQSLEGGGEVEQWREAEEDGERRSRRAVARAATTSFMQVASQ